MRAVRAKLLGCDRKIDGLQERVRGRAGLRMRRRRPVAEGQKADFLHGGGGLVRVPVRPRWGWWACGGKVENSNDVTCLYLTLPAHQGWL